MKRTLLTLTLLCMMHSAFCMDKPWTFWYWMYGAVSEEGIRADLKAMKDAGLGGCYLMPIRGIDDKGADQLPPLPAAKAQQLSPEFWQRIDLAMQQADSLGLEMGLHICDGFALAGGPWISPEESMQKIVSMSTNITGGTGKRYLLMRPAGYEGYYEDIACYAIPTESCPMCVSPENYTPKAITWSPSITRDENGTFRASEAGWIQYEFPTKITLRSVEIIPSGNNIQSQRLKMLVSDDGEAFRMVKQFVPPRQGWQNTDFNLTYSIPETDGRFFRFEWTPEGSEPGAEDLDAAKWKAVLRLKDIRMSDQARINQWEGKSGLVWRIAEETTEEEAPKHHCPKLQDIIRVELDRNGKMLQPLPEGNWLVVRIGHTATGHTNATAGGGKGLECDKFSTEAVEKQVRQWFGEFMKREHAKVVKYLHVDSWECGSQNWSKNFADEFQRRRGYSLLPWLPVMVGIPLESATESERVLRDVRQTIDELKNEIFFQTVSLLAHEYGCQFSAESVAPTMMGDGMSHYKYVDVPMGEYWLNSPTHDKPNDMLDAISGAHVYGKPIVQAEGFTEVRGVWDETPAMIKPLLDRNFALGMNRLFFHVNTHNPWMDKKPGMTLDGIGLFFQRDQTWFPEARGFVDYITRCQRFLQRGKPVVDIVVYTGDNLPSRALTPDKVVPMLPGLFGSERVASEQKRLANEGNPMEESPVGVRHSAGILDLKDWVNPLHGYKYDSMNRDALDRWLSQLYDPVKDDMPHYRFLVIPENVQVSTATRQKIDSLKQYGIKVITKPVIASVLPGLSPDVILPEGIDFAHRKEGKDIHFYFLTNQTNSVQTFTAKFRVSRDATSLTDPLTGNELAFRHQRNGEYDCVDITLPPYGSVFVNFGLAYTDSWPRPQQNYAVGPIGEQLPWDILFRENGERIKTKQLFDWSQSTNDKIRYFSGHTTYTTTFKYKGKIEKEDPQRWSAGKRIFLRLPDVKDIAHVWVNGIDCGIAWTAPYEVEITKALRKGKNTLKIEVVNTWHNALRGMDNGKAPYDGIWTNAKYRSKGDALLPAGLLETPMIFTTTK